MTNRLETITFWCLSFLLFLSLIVPTPLGVLPIDLIKRLSLGLLVSLGATLWFIKTLRDREIVLPRSALTLSLLGLGVVFLISGIVTPDRLVALWGNALELTSAWGVLLLVFAALITAVFLATKERTVFTYGLLFLAFLVVILFQILQIFAPSLVAWANLIGGGANLIGTWSDFGIFVGLVFLSLLAIFELFDLKTWGSGRVLLRALGLVAFVGVIFAGSLPVWWLIAFFSLVLFLRPFWPWSRAVESEAKTRIWRPALFSLAVMVILIVLNFQGSLSPVFSGWYSRLNIAVNDIRPSWYSTWGVLKGTLQGNSLTGIGPNNFIVAWDKFKPHDTGPNPFSDYDFDAGYNFIGTSIVMTGLLGILAWVIFFVFFLWTGGHFWRQSESDPVGRGLVGLIFISASFLWLTSWFLMPGSVIIFLTFILTGLFLGLVANLGRAKWHLALNYQSLGGIVVSVLVAVLLIASLMSLFGTVTRDLAWYRYGVTLNTLAQGNPAEQAVPSLESAISLQTNEIFNRLMVNLSLAKLQNLIQRNPQNGNSTELQTIVTATVDQAVGAARQAINQHPDNYANWYSLGTVYESLIPLGVGQSYEAAVKAYQQSLTYNPQNVSILLALARASLSANNKTAAQSYTDKALAIEPYSVPTILYASQLDYNSGRETLALARLEKATTEQPTDPRLWFQLGYYRYQSGKYADAITALAQAVYLNPTAADGHYFLGLSYDAHGDSNFALREFNLLLASNPNNQMLKTMIANIQNGLPALDNLSSAKVSSSVLTATSTAATSSTSVSKKKR